MKSLSNLGIGLSAVFGCLVLALIAELYYLLWWKKRICRNSRIQFQEADDDIDHLFCWKNKPSSLASTVVNPQSLVRLSNESETNKMKPYGDDGIETELMRLHNLSGPPRFLFTIKEETKEDLESEDGEKSRKGSRSRSLSDLLMKTVEAPFLTPLSSPAFFTPPLPPKESYSYSHGFNPLFESSTDVEMNSSIKPAASPPPKFKFLKDAEEKLKRRILEENEKRVLSRGLKSTPCKVKVEEDGSYITILVNKNQEKELTSSQILPLSTSPSAIIKV